MKKVAVFGNAGGGKSTLSKRLSEITGLPLHVLDKIQYQVGGTPVPHEVYKHGHQQILVTDRWIIDGFGCKETVWLRLDEADTLVFVDLPIHVHFWWVTKRMIAGFFKPPEGWPEKSPILKSSLNSYRVLWLCYKYLTPKYREYIEQAQNTKRVYHISSTEQISQFYELIGNETNLEDGTA
ncbi:MULTISPECIES: adenylate kinase [unclassified Coleofasciculus]|uniref:adenylate kinase n=1 Tax=Cyanophyceae TaxID=3028117 RepID=UPI001684CAF7|nr:MULTISPECIES: adenylate kinase [unclassified Coleofasciculus]MBD2087579.1 adenylate kinase [Coleofasciculus sp. FACHB-542]MBD2540067.1 adenylate kinase [Coleofasciculus sp. FACHB-SPT36]